jgi:hypothetical protein
MQKKRQPDYGRLRDELSRLFQNAGYEQNELLDFINTAERETNEPVKERSNEITQSDTG